MPSISRAQLFGIAWRQLRKMSCCAGLLGLLVGAIPVAAQQPDFIASHPELILNSDQSWGTLGLNVAAHQDGTPGQPLRIGNKTYSEGLGHHASGSITILLDGQYTAFDAEVGLQPCAGGSVVFRVLVDGQQRFDSGTVRSGEASRPVHIELGREAQELRLAADDAGDGISCDMANWAEARLTPAPATGHARGELAGLDVAPFARVVTWDPHRVDGARASRIEEFRAEDVFTETELKPNADKTFTLPVSLDGSGCIGLQWLNRRNLRELGLEFVVATRIPDTNTVRVEGWFGESAWQGEWKRLEGEFRLQNQQISFRPGMKSRVQTQKVRWVLPGSPRNLHVRLSACTHSSWATTNLFVQLEKPLTRTRGKAFILNGEIISTSQTSDSQREIPWDLGRPLHLAVRYSRPSSLNSDPTVLQFQLPGRVVAVAVSDVLSNECIYLPDAGLFIAREPVPVTLADYKQRIAGKKSILQEVRNLPDQTLEMAMSRTHHDAQHEGPVMLSLACDNTKFVVERDGIVRFHPEPFEWLSMHRQVDWQPWFATGYELRPQLGIGKGDKLTRSLEGDWLPIPAISMEKNGIRYTERSFVAPYDQERGPAESRCSKSVCVVEFTAANEGPSQATANLSLSFRASVNENEPIKLVAAGPRVLVSARGQPIAVVDFADAGNSKTNTSGGNLDWTRLLASGEKSKLVVYLPGEGVEPEEVASLRGAPRLREETQKYWIDLMAGAMQVKTPDTLLNNVIRSSRVRCLIDSRSEAQATRVAASIAAMSYGPLESEAHSVIRGMDFMGHSEFARRSLDFFIHRYNTNGFLTTGYTTFGTAWHLWALGEHYQLTRDGDWLRQVAPEIARVCHWVTRQLKKTRKLDAFGRPVPESGLMPPGVLADWNSFAYHFAMNAYYVAGLRSAGEALGEIGYPDARQFAKTADQLQKDTLRAYAWTQARSPALPLRDGTWIPHYPSQVHSPGKLAEFFPGQDAGRSWCYDVEIGAHQLVPTGVLNPHSREVERLMEHMEDVQFLASGWFDYPAAQNQADWINLGGFSKVQPYYTRNCEVYALRDEVKPFIRSYFNSIASLLNPEVLSFWEHFHHSGAWDKTHETGYFLHQTRTMLVQERGTELWLAPFVTDNWLRDGLRVGVKNAPTRFGVASFEITSHVARGYMEAQIEPPTRRKPSAIVLRLRHPQCKEIQAVTVNGKKLRSFDRLGNTITFKPSKTALNVRAEF
jgi:hypothetical protein